MSKLLPTTIDYCGECPYCSFVRRDLNHRDHYKCRFISSAFVSRDIQFETPQDDCPLQDIQSSRVLGNSGIYFT